MNELDFMNIPHRLRGLREPAETPSASRGLFQDQLRLTPGSQVPRWQPSMQVAAYVQCCILQCLCFASTPFAWTLTCSVALRPIGQREGTESCVTSQATGACG